MDQKSLKPYNAHAESKSNQGSKGSLMLSLNGSGGKQPDSRAISMDQISASIKSPEPPIAKADELRLQVESDMRELTNRTNALPLPFELLKHGLSCIGTSPDAMRRVYLRLSLPNASLKNIHFLQNYIYLQKIEVPGNGISDISVLENLKYLVTLDLSYNILTSFDLTSPPPNLQELDLSNNLICTIPTTTFSKLPYLKRLALGHNKIRAISDSLKECRILKHLSISNNALTHIDGLDNLPITHLDVSHNEIENLAGLSTLQDLEELRANDNCITDIANHDIKGGWESDNHPVLRYLDLQNNKISNPEELCLLEPLRFLRNLSFNGNPVTQCGIEKGEYTRQYSLDTLTALDTQNSQCCVPKHTSAVNITSEFSNSNGSYRLHMFYILAQLTSLDGIPITAEEKIASLNRFQPPPCVVESMRHACAMQKQFKNHANIKSKSLNADAQRLVAICSPTEAGKRDSLALRLINEFPHLFGFAVTHTTRKARVEEIDGISHHFVGKIEMKRMISRQKCIQVVEILGNIYATTFEAVQRVYDDGKMCILNAAVEDLEVLRTQSFLKVVMIDMHGENTAGSVEGKDNAASSSFERSSSSCNSNSNQAPAIVKSQVFDQESFDLLIIAKDSAYLELKRSMIKWYLECNI